MKNIIIYTATILMSLSLWNCTGRTGPNLNPEPDRNTFKKTPAWFNVKPKKDGYIYTTSVATSRDYQTSISKATVDARKQLAETLDSEVKGVTDRVIEETGLGADSEFTDNFTNTAEIIVESTIQGAEVINQETVEVKSDEGDIFRSWILLEYDQGYQQKRLLDAIKADKVLYDKLRATELLGEMEEKVEAYRKRKAQ